jgi:hypothetical protein
MALNPNPLHSSGTEEVIQADEAAAFLAELGINVSEIHDSLLDAVDAASMRDDPFWANTARGIELWSTLVHGVRELLHDNGEWTIDNPQNRPVMIRDEGRYEFALAGGDSGTGSTELTPGLARKAGKATIQSANRFSQVESGALIPIRDLTTASEAENHPRHPFGTWILLYRCTKEAIFSEISVPAHIASDGVVNSWRLRVLLPTITDFGDKVTRPLPENLDDDVDFFIA